MKKNIYFIVFFAFILSFILLLFTAEPMQRDSYSYEVIGINIANGYGYVDDSHMPTMEREPVYPFFLACVYSVFGQHHFPVQIIQIILFLLTILLIYKTAGVIFDEKTALYSMAITGFFPTLLNYPAYILSETVFIFLLSLSMFGCVKIYFSGKTGYYVLTGVALALTALCKSVMLPFIFIFIITLILLVRSKIKNYRKLSINIGVMIFVYTCFIGPWMYRNHLNFGTFSLRAGSEAALCVKAQKLSYDLEDFKKDFIFIISENLGKHMFPDTEKSRDFLFKQDVIARENILPGLRDKGYSNREIRNTMMSKILKRPFKFLAVSSLDLFKMTQFTYLPLLIDQEYLMKKADSVYCGDFLLSLARAIFRLQAYLLILLSMVGAWIKRDLWKNWVFLFILICYTNLVYSLIYSHGRYGVPLIPFYIILSAPAIREIMRRVMRCQK